MGVSMKPQDYWSFKGTRSQKKRPSRGLKARKQPSVGASKRGARAYDILVHIYILNLYKIIEWWQVGDFLLISGQERRENKL